MGRSRSGERSARAISNPDAVRDHGRAEVRLFTGTESAAFDKWAMEDVGVPSPVLMENAGRSAALVLHRIHPTGRVVALVGPGNNGGDGIVLARTLRSLGREVRVFALGDRPDPDPLLHGWPIPVRPVPQDDGELELELAGGRVLVDALLGTGARGAPREPYARVIRALNRSPLPVVALDLPSGLDAESGSAPGEVVWADLTVAFGAPKVGSALFPGREHSGRLVAVEIGFPPVGDGHAGARLITPGWARSHRPRRSVVTHKNAEGRLLILAGSPGVAGAAILAARAALRAGVGYVRISSSPENRVVLQSTVPEALFVDATDEDALAEALRSSDALVAGPGMGVGEVEGERLDGLLARSEGKSVLLDADALTLLGRGALPAFREAASPGRRLLTPHPGEAARIGAEPGESVHDPLGVVRRIGERWGAAVLLKGTPSVVAGPQGGEVWVGTTGSSDLASAGMGDVLSGTAGAFLARGTEGWMAGALALHFTGRAARRSGGRESLLPSDVVDHLSGALAEEETSSVLDLPFVILDLRAAH